MPLKPRTDLTIEEVDGEFVVLDRLNERIHQLNATASFIWRRCDGGTDAHTIADDYAAAFAIDIELAAADVARTLAELQTLSLLEEATDTE